MLSLTPREAAEQVFAATAYEDYLREQKQQALYNDVSDAPKTVVKTDEEAKQIADTPHLTDWDEWNELELAETDPNKPPLKRDADG